MTAHMIGLTFVKLDLSRQLHRRPVSHHDMYMCWLQRTQDSELAQADVDYDHAIEIKDET